MSNAGIFTLITNDGKQDRMLMATDLLKRRLADITSNRRMAGMSDTTPTLLDIERTHVLFMNAHFKPFAAIGFEYQKVQSDSGGANLGSSVRFSIPQFGDFFSDMALYVKFNTQTLTNTAGVGANRDLYRYCEYPGERLLQNVKFDVNGNPLDEYTSDVYNMYREHVVQPNKMVGWKRLMGQEIPETVYLDQTSESLPTTRTKIDYCNGYQTPKGAHDALEVMIPLLFWFNQDPRLAVPSVSIPYGQRFLNIELATQNQMVGIVTRAAGDGTDTASLSDLTVAKCELFINNIFVNPEVHDIFIKRIGFTLIRVHRIQKTRVDKQNASILLNQMKWPIESMFVAIKPSANTATTRHGLTDDTTLDNWHKSGQVTTDAAFGVEGVGSSMVDFALKAPLDLAIAVADAAGTAAAQDALYAALAGTDAATIELQAASAAAAALTGADSTSVYSVVQAAAVAKLNALSSGIAATGLTNQCSSVVDKLSITVHGIDIYKEMPSLFFNAYTPFTYGGHNIKTPDDCGSLMITFCLYPGSYQPSGHINVSRAREFYLQYWAHDGLVTSALTADLLVVASAINFLLISDGSAVLRYST
jgi:hypothetical protein